MNPTKVDCVRIRPFYPLNRLLTKTEFLKSCRRNVYCKEVGQKKEGKEKVSPIWTKLGLLRD